jgi:outer membrane protein OmpA-like peptidoglycan-associated protein
LSKERTMAEYFWPAIVLSASLALAPVARAQTNPTSDELIKSLTPTAQSLKSSGTRGLHRLPPASDAAAPAAQAVQPARHAAAQRPAVGTDAASASIYVQFASGSAELTPQATTALDELGKALSSNALSDYHFRIEGHTDTVGSKEYNRALSERRAEAVVAYIEQKFKIDGARLTPVGLGSEHLLVPTGDQTPEARNRRVAVVNLGA